MTYSIIIPTYNSERWIKSCLGSALSQQGKDFDVIVLDGGSSDSTIRYLQSISDSRLRIYPAGRRLSITENWARITTIPRNEFMTILGHDDILYPNYLETMSELIRQYPDAGLYQTHFNFIDENEAVIRPCKSMPVILQPADMLERIMQNNIVIVATGFMIRSKDYDALGGIPSYPNLLYADSTLWLKAIDQRFLAVASTVAFAFRFHADNTSKVADDSRLIAFEMMVEFFASLKRSGKEYKSVIDDNALAFMKSYVTGACNKLLYVPVANRKNLSIARIIETAEKCAALLAPGERFEPKKIPAVKLARLIDSNAVLKKMFLLYKGFSKRTF